MTLRKPEPERHFELIERADRRTGQVGVERIEDPLQMRDLLEQAVLGARREACSTLPAGPYPLEMLRSSWDTDLAVIKSGVSVPVIYQADAARPPVMLRYLAEFAAAGARVRVAARVTHRTVIVDRKVVFVGVRADSLGLPMLLVREPALVRNFCAQFAALWRSSHSVGVGPEDSLGDESVREILAMLNSGVTDDVAAERLGVSPRTIRRRVAAVLDLLGASSRFEAGAKAVQAGWL